MNYLSAENLTKYYGEKKLFTDISIYLNKGQKMALIAKNGSGKTSLLNILAGEESPDEGDITIHPSIRVGYLKQDTIFPPHFTVEDFIYQSDNPIIKLIQQYEESLLQSQLNNADLDASLLEKMDVAQAWDYDNKIKEILSKLAITDLNQNIGSLSGGEKKRVSLAALLIQNPDLLILDEPTNHLDIAMIEWLEKYLSTSNMTFLVVTHDRYFLNQISDEIIELEDYQLYKYKGNYNYYLDKRAERIHNQAHEVEAAKTKLKKEKEWMNRQPPARTTKAKSRIESFFQIKDKASQGVQDEAVKFHIEETRLGNKIIILKNVSKRYDDKILLHNFSYIFNSGDRIGIIGKNGSGKSTLMKILTGEIKPDSGHIKWGETVHFGHYEQSGLTFKEDQRVIDVIRDIAEYIPLQKGKKLTAPQLLNHFLFPYDTHRNYVKTLSGGEKRRLYLLTIIMRNPNVLILDEPTNDLDLVTLDVLETFLIHFKGVLLVVSHDRYFTNKMVDHLFVLKDDGSIQDFPGNYSHYQQWLKTEHGKSQNQSSSAKKEKTVKADKPKTKLSFNEKREFEQLEMDIEKLEAEKQELELELQGELPHQRLMVVSQRLGIVVSLIEEKSDRWLTLSEFV